MNFNSQCRNESLWTEDDIGKANSGCCTNDIRLNAVCRKYRVTKQTLKKTQGK